MLPCSMVLCPELEEEGEGGKTALIDQRAVAAGKNSDTEYNKRGNSLTDRPHQEYLSQVNILQYSIGLE